MTATFFVGITGGIGSGKTAVTDRLQELGVTIVDADVVARRVVEPGSEALKQIATRYGAEILLSDGSLDRAALRKIVFEDEGERKWLEHLTHPLIGKQIGEELALSESDYAVLVSPLLLEGTQKDLVDHIVVVDVPEEVQLERAMSRDQNSEQLVRKIMAAQLSRVDRLRQADSVIDNSGDLATLQMKIQELHDEFRQLARTSAPRR